MLALASILFSGFTVIRNISNQFCVYSFSWCTCFSLCKCKCFVCLGDAMSYILITPLRWWETNNPSWTEQDKNRNWLETDQLAIYKRSRGVELGATEGQLQQAASKELNPATAWPRQRHWNNIRHIVYSSACWSIIFSLQRTIHFEKVGKPLY